MDFQLEIPEALREKTLRTFGEKARKWQSELDGIFRRALEKWGLTPCGLTTEPSYNLVCFAESPTYGAVALKIGVPHADLFTEMKALSIYGGAGICTCYDTDPELGALLIERIQPGDDLRTVADLPERFRIAADLIRRLPIPLPLDLRQVGRLPEVELPTFADWIGKAFARVRSEGRATAGFLGLVDTAEVWFAEINGGHRPQVLLHGDLHHMNILRSGEDSWKAIDPKGAYGPHCLETGRFINNQIGFSEPTERLSDLDQNARIFGEAIGESPRVVAICAFIDRVLGASWSIEDNADPDGIAQGEEQCAVIVEYIDSL